MPSCGGVKSRLIAGSEIGDIVRLRRRRQSFIRNLNNLCHVRVQNIEITAALGETSDNGLKISLTPGDFGTVRYDAVCNIKDGANIFK